MQDFKKSSIRNEFLSCLGLLVTTLILWAPYQSRYTPPMDGLWQIPTAALSVGDSRFGVSPFWSIHIGPLTLPAIAGPYLGVFKSYLLAPLLLIFPKYALASLFLNALLFTIVSWLLYKVSSLYVSKYLAGLAVLLLFGSNGYFFAAQMDYGPFLVGSAALLGFIWAGTIAFRRKSATAGRIACALLGFGIADKLTISLIVFPAIIGASIIVLRIRSNRRMRYITSCILLFIAPLIPEILYLSFGGMAELKMWTGPNGGVKWTELNFSGLANTAGSFLQSGWGPKNPTIFSSFFGLNKPDVSLHLEVAVLFVLFIIPTALLLILKKKEITWPGQVIVFWPGVSLIAIKFMEYRPWHLLPIVPLFILSIVTLLDAFTRSLKAISKSEVRLGEYSRSQELKILGKKSGKTIIAAAVLLSIFQFASRATSLIGVEIASPTTIHIAQKLDKLRFKNIICLDYSMCISVLAEMTNHGVPIKADFTFSQVFRERPVESIAEVMKCGDILLTRKSKFLASLAAPDLLQKNSQLLVESISFSRLRLKKVAFVSTGENSISAWRQINCAP